MGPRYFREMGCGPRQDMPSETLTKKASIVDFYRGEVAPTNCPHRIHDILLDWDDTQWEGCHNHIQWVFPTDEASVYNPDAPVLTEEDIRAMREDSLVQHWLQVAYERFLKFAGLKLSSHTAYHLTMSHNWYSRQQIVWDKPEGAPTNHNWLRITRIIRSLSLLHRSGIEGYLFGAAIQHYVKEGRIEVPTRTAEFWARAVEDAKERMDK